MPEPYSNSEYVEIFGDLLTSTPTRLHPSVKRLREIRVSTSTQENTPECELDPVLTIPETVEEEPKPTDPAIKPERLQSMRAKLDEWKAKRQAKIT